MESALNRDLVFRMLVSCLPSSKVVPHLIFGGNGSRHMTRILSNKFKYITLKFLTEQMSNINCRLENSSRNATGKKNLYKKKMVIY